jgi:probable HAF family extracellular repeat protein
MHRTASLVAGTLLLAACSDIPEAPLLDSGASATDAVAPLATVSHIDLGTLGGASSFATDVNDLGTVVGWSETASGMTHAFRWTVSRGMTDLGTLPGDDWSRAISITGTGQILGVSGRTGEVNGSPVVWSASGVPTPLSIPLTDGAGFMQPEAHNERDLVTGSTAGGSRPSHAWAWSASAGTYDITAHLPDFIELGFGESYGSDVNGRGMVVGTNHSRACVRSAECWHGFIWNARAGYRDIGLPQGDDLSSGQVVSLAINDLGAVVGWTSPHGAFPPTQPYLWAHRAGFTVLPNFTDDPSGQGGYAQDLNYLGTAVGASWEPDDGFQAAAWPRAGGIVRLSPDDSNPSVAMAVNGTGVVVGWSSLDCCGFLGTHATLWKVGPGRGTTPAPVAAASSSRSAAAARAWAETAEHGPVTCLSNPSAMLSKARFVGCVAQGGT